MSVERSLRELASYWGVHLDDDAFLSRLNGLHAKYPRIFDAVEMRTFAGLTKLVPLEPGTGTMLEATTAWLKRLQARAVVENLIADAQFSDANSAYLKCYRWWSEYDFVALVAKKKAALKLADQAEAEKREAERRRVEGLVDARQREATAVSQEAEFRRIRNVSRHFDILVFDLDDTLLKSAHLEEFRGRENIGNDSLSYINKLKKEAKGLQHLISEETLLEIKDGFPDVHLGIFTRAPRAYAITILETCYPRVEWDSIVAFDDVARTKPDPMGIWQAARSVGVKELSRIAVIGDEKNDVLAAYQAGAFAILYTRAWGSDWKFSNNRADHYRAIEFMPDAIVDRPDQFIRIISEPWQWLPMLESCDVPGAYSKLKPHRAIDRRNHFNNLESTPSTKQWVEIFSLGRYFTAHKNASTYDFRLRGDKHSMTLAIVEAKDGGEYPDNWIERCADYISAKAEVALEFSERVIVCPVPARPERPRRIERLVDRIAKAIGSKNGIHFDNDVLRFREGIISNKTLNAEERFINIRDHLYVADNSSVGRKYVIVVDDITTTGATFYYADRYLRKAGADGVHCFSLAHAIS